MHETIIKNNLFFRQLLFLAIIIAIGIVIFNHLSFVVGSFLGALTLYIVYRETLFRLIEKRGWKPWLAALMFIVLTVIVLCALLFGVFKLIGAELSNLKMGELFDKAKGVPAMVNDFMGFTVISAGNMDRLASYATNLASGVLNSTYSAVINILLMLIILYFMLARGRKMEYRLRRYNPFRGESRHLINDEVTGIIYSNAVGIPVIMLGQGLVAALVYWMFGMEHVVFWAFVTALAGLIPMVGTMIVSIPLGVSFIMAGAVWKGVLLMLVGMLVIANVDNLIRIILNNRMTGTHPLVVIFGVIIGIPLFGFWGIIFGPLLISIFLLLIRIYYTEFRMAFPTRPDKGCKGENTQKPKESGGQ